MKARPLAVTIIGLLYIVAGAAGAVFHLIGFKMQHPFQYDIVWAELVNLVAIVSGAYMLRGCNWARWLALAWMAFHVILSAFHALPELAIHTLFLAVLAYFLFRPTANRYFLTAGTQ